ncbi:polyketide synthase-like protein [Hypoxylon argillaceum]|nr:polyketide synthase-like protein [Hypoxylon argillaceum]
MAIRTQADPRSSSRGDNHVPPEDDPVCIVGMACHLPGGVKSLADLWQFLLEEKSAQGLVPPERYNIKGFYSPEADKAGVMNVDGGYFLQEDVRQFDNEFFGIHSFEATHMDPQQRKLLEVIFECLENSGSSLAQMSGSNTGVYVGNFSQDHLLMQIRDPDDLRRYHATGAGLTMLANRISHVFNLHGPSLTLDTACSSSIYCLNLAVAALKAGDCDGALVASSNLVMTPNSHVAAMKAGMLSPTSTCHTFDASADGYARAEAVNAIYLKRLSSALQNNDTIYSIVRGTATNANGHTPGVVNPSSEFQEAVMRKAYRNANLDFCDTDYVECHGTGTELGDLVEITALSNCFLSGRERPLKIGGSKPNFGHSEAASSLTSLIKVSLAFQRGLLPPTRGVVTPNPKLDLKRRNIEVVTETQAWPRELQRASICSSGYGGANAHAILESYSSYVHRSVIQSIQVPPKEQCLVLPVSAASMKSLEIRTDEISRLAESCNTAALESLSYTLAERGTHHRYRASLVITNGQIPLAEDGKTDLIEISHPSIANPLDFAFVFTGQGSQYHGMGKELLDKSPVFLTTIRELDQVIESLPTQYLPGWTLEGTLRESSDTAQIHQVTRSQPLCTAVQIGLVNILSSWGVAPSAVVGHSSGEIAAAYTSGLISASQAILAAYFRGYAVAHEPAQGAMLACGLTIEEAELLIHKLGLSDEVCVACVNARTSVTLSGLREGINIIHSELQAQKKFCRLLETGGQAYHSTWMKAAGAKYEELLAPYFQNQPQKETSGVAMYSTAGWSKDGPVILDKSISMARYWRDNLERSVQFEAALSHLIQKQRFHLLEIGPHSALKGPINQIRLAAQLDDQETPYSPTLIRSQGAYLCMQRLAGRLFVSGHDLRWQAINSVKEHNRSLFQDLPTYPWDYSAGLRWFEPRASIELRNRPYTRHELLGSQQVAGNGIDCSWRNVLRADEVPWIRDHKIESQVIFPAAGYLAIAIEAVARVYATRKGVEPSTFDFESVSINAAMVVPDEDDLKKASVELHTTLSLRKLSAKTTSAGIYDFTISSWVSGQSVVHCVGSVTVSGSPFEKTIMIDDISRQRDWAVDRWHEKFEEEGIFFGPYFRSLTSVHTDKTQVRAAVQCSTHIQPPKTRELATPYVVHPLTVDACLQATLISGTRGDIGSFRSYVPVFMSRCRIQKPSILSDDQQGIIHAQSQRTGFSTLRADCVLEDHQGLPIVEMEGVKLARYMSRLTKMDTNSNPHLERHPVMQVKWKPDITRLAAGSTPQLESYIAGLAQQEALTASEHDIAVIIGSLLDLAGHKNPRMRVARIGAERGDLTENWQAMLGKGTAFPRLRSWESIRPEQFETLTRETSTLDTYDVVVYDESETQDLWGSSASQLLSLVKEGGIIITRKSDAALAELRAAMFLTTVIKEQVVLAVQKIDRTALCGLRFLLLAREISPSLQRLFAELSELLVASGARDVDVISLDKLSTFQFSEDAVCISFLEIEEPFLATLRQEDMELLHYITNNVNNIIWLTGADMLGTPNPNLTLVHGLSRALMVEQPSVRFSVMDVGSLNTLSSDPEEYCDILIDSIGTFKDDDEKEFTLFNNLLYISRVEPDIGISSFFRRRISQEHSRHERLALSAAQPARLSIGNVGVTDSMYFQQLCEPYTPPPTGYIDVQVKAVSLNAKDIYTINGHVETRTGTAAIEFAGVVTAVGSDVQDLEPGDRVVVITPNSFSTTERIPSWTAHKLLPEEDFAVMATLPTIYCSALYAIRDRAHLRSQESILVHSGAGALGIAAITIAKRIGAVVYATAGSEKRKRFLIDNLGIPATHVFNSRDDSFVAGLKAITKGRGADVVINSLTGDLMHASWRCLAVFGRFVEVGKRDIVDDGRLEMNVFARNTTFTAFDLSEMFFQEGDYYESVMAGLVKDVLKLYRSGEIQAVPITTFDVSEIAEAYRYFSSADRVGKIVVSLDNPKSLLTVAPSIYSTILDPEKVYLLVGALGGLGRSLTQWMMIRGARKFVFLQRSGCDKPGTQDFVDQLKRDGAQLTVIKGDVTVFDDVKASVTACRDLGGSLGGVVQAAMGLHEDLFSHMDSASWQTSVMPKWKGTWNLHNAIDGYDEFLDFFLMTSSMNGTVGIPTESNYGAANAFLDAFAFWRRSQGKPATSLGLGMISEVGYLHENPDIEALLLHRGTHPLNESDFLQLLDLAIGGTWKAEGTGSAYAMPAHILTGLETISIQRFFEKGFEVSNSVLDDPRSSILTAALEMNLRTAGWSQDRTSYSDALLMGISWLQGLPGDVSSILGAEKTAADLKEAILGALRRRFSHLLLTPIDQMDDKKSFVQFGIDSMIAAEFRTWLWNTFKVDVPYLDLLSHHKSLDSIAEFVEVNLPRV